MSILSKKEILINTKNYIKNIKTILNEGDNKLSEQMEIDFYTLQVTLEGLLNINEQQEKDILYYRDHVIISTCGLCGKEFKHKKKTVKYCPTCSKAQAYENWKKSLTGDKLEKRREQGRNGVRAYRKRLKEKGMNSDENN